MPDTSRLTTFVMSDLSDWWEVKVETPLPSTRVDFQPIFLGMFHGAFVQSPETFNYNVTKLACQITYRIPKVAISESVLSAFLGILRWTVTISDKADESHALYLHMLPHPTDTWNEDWKPTKMGKLVENAKSYNLRTGDKAAAEELAAWMKKWVDKHPRYRAADIIVPAPPGNKDKRFDLPLVLAELLGNTCGMTLKLCEKVSESIPQKQVKGDLEALSANVSGKSCMKHDLREKTVLALDDIYRSGTTMQELVRACRAAGAKCVLSLAATKAAKYCTGLTASDWFEVSKEAES